MVKIISPSRLASYRGNGIELLWSDSASRHQQIHHIYFGSLQSTMSVFIQMQSPFQPSEAHTALQALCNSDIISLDEVLHWIAKDEDPNAPDDSLERLDSLAAGIHLPNPSDTLDVICRINQHLFHKHRFSGDTEDYYHPQNSLIHKVLARKKGCPLFSASFILKLQNDSALKSKVSVFPDIF